MPASSTCTTANVFTRLWLRAQEKVMTLTRIITEILVHLGRHRVKQDRFMQSNRQPLHILKIANKYLKSAQHRMKTYIRDRYRDCTAGTKHTVPGRNGNIRMATTHESLLNRGTNRTIRDIIITAEQTPVTFLLV
jgi:hypothetical protein